MANGGAPAHAGATSHAGRAATGGGAGLGGEAGDAGEGGASGEAGSGGVNETGSAGAFAEGAGGDDGAGTGGDDGDGGDGGELVLEPVTLPDPQTIAGPLTSTNYGAQPFFTPAAMAEVQQGSFAIGRALFVTDWLTAPDTARPTFDGLGPLFHASSCVSCHEADRRAPTLQAGGGVSFGMLFRLAQIDQSGAFTAGDPVFGTQFQPLAIAGVPSEGIVEWETDSIGRPLFEADPDPTYGELADNTVLLPRASPLIIGAGLFELVDDATLIALEDPNDSNEDGISGRAARFNVPGGTRIGRFGWKAIHPTLRGQTAGAFVGDIGITSPDHPYDDCSGAQSVCWLSPSGGTPEISSVNLEAVDQFMTYLSVPAARRSNRDPVQQRGAAVFEAIGCASCHRPSLTTGNAPGAPSLAHVTFFAYTDLLLHDLGPYLSDGAGEGAAEASEWRTPPLWGLGLVEQKPDARFLHDARATTLAAAIGWHGGEAQSSARAFARLRADDQQALLAFLRSL